MPSPAISGAVIGLHPQSGLQLPSQKPIKTFAVSAEKIPINPSAALTPALISLDSTKDSRTARNMIVTPTPNSAFAAQMHFIIMLWQCGQIGSMKLGMQAISAPKRTVEIPAMTLFANIIPPPNKIYISNASTIYSEDNRIMSGYKVFPASADIVFKKCVRKEGYEMINEINASQRYGVSGITKSASQPAAEKSAKVSQTEQSAKVDTIEIGTKQEASVTYEKVTSKKLSAEEIASLKADADKATENLRKLVEELILKQDKNYKKSTEDSSSEDLMTKLGITTEDVEAAKQAISEDGEFGVKAVSDRLVDFAKSISGGDKSKLSELVSAIDEGFSAAKKALGSELPDISQQTYDETIRKLNDWASETDS